MTMQDTINRNLLQYAAGHQIFCPQCRTILDMRQTVHVDLAGKPVICCCACFDKGKAKLYAYALSIGKPVEVIDGREVFPVKRRAKGGK